jgi:pilus assembly protein Flp/PilA
MKNLLARFIKEEDGQDLIEYALLAALIAIAAVAIMTTVGGSINTIFSKVNGKLTTAS